MTFDPIDTNDDGVVDADVDNESVNTESIRNTADILNSTSDLVGFDNISGTIQSRGQESDAVGTTAETILTFEGRTAIIYVAGTNTSGAGSGVFLDKVTITNGLSPSVTNTLDANGAATRSYSETNRDVQLAMGSDTYDINAYADIDIGV